MALGFGIFTFKLQTNIVDYLVYKLNNRPCEIMSPPDRGDIFFIVFDFVVVVVVVICVIPCGHDNF